MPEWCDEPVVHSRTTVDVDRRYSFDPTKYIPSKNDNSLIDYSLPIYNAWTMVSENYVDHIAPVLSVDSKTFMSYHKFGTQSWNRQRKLSECASASTGQYGIRIVDGRMLIALGTGFTKTVGAYVDVLLADGTVLACMIGDVKADRDTDDTNTYQKYDYSILEFIIDLPQGMDASVYLQGKGSYSELECFNSPVVAVRVYDKVCRP